MACQWAPTLKPILPAQICLVSVAPVSPKLLKLNAILMSLPIVEATCPHTHCNSYINLGRWMTFMHFLSHKSFNLGNSQTLQRNHPGSQFLLSLLATLSWWVFPWVSQESALFPRWPSPQGNLAQLVSSPQFQKLHMSSRTSRWMLFKLFLFLPLLPIFFINCWSSQT